MDADKEVQRLRAQVEVLRAQLDVMQEMLVELRESAVMVIPGFWHGKSASRVRTLMSDQVAMDREVAARVAHARDVGLMSRREDVGEEPELPEEATNGSGAPIP